MSTKKANAKKPFNRSARPKVDPALNLNMRIRKRASRAKSPEQKAMDAVRAIREYHSLHPEDKSLGYVIKSMAEQFDRGMPVDSYATAAGPGPDRDSVVQHSVIKDAISNTQEQVPVFDLIARGLLTAHTRTIITIESLDKQMDKLFGAAYKDRAEVQTFLDGARKYLDTYKGEQDPKADPKCTTDILQAHADGADHISRCIFKMVSRLSEIAG